ncbi:MAG: hypothetical protein HYX67_11565 [Candidatus Melainabacteria bacterium]|nr:hypothetical protein [Candidatus Melainabacteria bacterium]
MTSMKFAFATLLATCIGASTLSCDAAPAAKKPEAGSDIAKLKVELDTTGIARTTKVEIEPKDPYDPKDELMTFNASPMHVQIIFDGKKPKYGDNDFNEPHLLIYPLSQWASMFPKAKEADFNKRLDGLKKAIASKSSKGLDTIPILPESDGAEFLHAQESYLKFNNGSGSGISFISVYGNGDPPVNESDFFYTFQGITSDNKYYVSFFWPVKATGLPKDLALEKSKAYVQKLTRAKFAPSLDVLDKVVSSITLK